MSGCNPIGRIAVVALGLLWMPARAAADADEASLHLELRQGLVWAEENDIAKVHLRGPLNVMGVGLRGTYAINDWYSFDARLALDFVTDGVTHLVETEDETYTVERTGLWALVDAGVRARLGVAMIPTVYLGLGTGLRRTSIEEHYAQHDWFKKYPPRGGNGNVTVIASVGLHHRSGATWIMGIELEARHAIISTDEYQAVALILHLGGFWYPFLDN